MDAKALLTVMSRQLYEDIRFVAQQNPAQTLDEEGTRPFNALLGRARRVFPEAAEVLADFSDWSPRNIKYKDALLVTGQLCAALSALVEGPVALPASPRPQQGQPAPQQAAPQGPAQRTPVPQQSPRQTAPQSAPAAAGHAAHQRASRQNTPMNDSLDLEDPYDRELYGPNRPPQRNDDGTIPFSLE